MLVVDRRSPSGRSARPPAPRRRAAATSARSGRRRRGPSRRAWRSGRRRCPAARSRCAMLVLGSCDQAPPSEPIGTRDMLSTPPATTRSSQPLATFCAAMFTASRPEAQKRLICTPATLTSQPALSAAVLAITEPCSPTGETTPMTTSSSARRVEAVALLQLDEQAGQQVDRLDLVQAAVLLALAARRANGHRRSSLVSSSSLAH